MKLYLVRHGQTDFNVGNITQGGGCDIPLNATGVEQARKLAQDIKDRNLHFDVYYRSSMVRAKQTAEIITDGKADFIEDDLLKERSFGELEGKKVDWSEIGDIFDRRVNYDGHGIEPIRDLLARSKTFLDKIAAKYPDDASILVVAHGALLRTMHFNIIGYDDNTDFPAFRFENCEMREYEIPSRKR